MSDFQDAIEDNVAGARFDAGRVISDSFSIYFKNFVPFTLIALIVLSPTILYTILFLREPPPLLGPGGSIESWHLLAFAGSFLVLALQPIATGAIIYGVFEQLRTPEGASVGACLGVGVRKLVPILGVGILSALIIMGGFILLVIPGIIFFIALYPAVPAAVVDQKSPMEAIRYSFALTKGHRGQIFGIVLVVAILGGIIPLALERAVLARPGMPMSPGNYHIYLVVKTVVNILSAALSAVASALTFYQLRIADEGIDAEELAAVFD